MLEHPGLRRWLDRNLSAAEGALLERLRLVPRTPPLFVVGPPRCGTTALFLTLVNRFQLAFFPNLAKRHPRAPFSYALMGGLLGRYEPTLTNRFGIVDQDMAPSDGWELFQGWIPNRYGAAPRPGGDARLRTLTRLFELRMGGPLCVRNNVNSLRIEALDTLFPGALFVAITRDWREAALSLREAYRAHGTPPGEWWSAGPPEYAPEGFEDGLEKAAFQILGVEAILRRDLPSVDSRRRLLVGYDDFCAQPERVVAWVERAYARIGVALRPRAGVADAGRARRSARRLRADDPDVQRMAQFGRRFLQGDHLSAPHVLTPAVRSLVGNAV